MVYGPHGQDTRFDKRLPYGDSGRILHTAPCGAPEVVPSLGSTRGLLGSSGD